MVDLGPLSQDPWLPPTLPWPPSADEGGEMKQLARPVAHRRWLFNTLVGGIAIVGGLVCAVNGWPGEWTLLVSLPVTTMSLTGWWKTRPSLPRPDYVRIALLEQELLGAAPEPRPQPPSGPGSATPAA